MLYCKSESDAVLVFQITSADVDVSAVVETCVILGALAGAADIDTPHKENESMSAIHL